MTNKTYDRLKFVAQVVLPALATLYTALAAAWGFGHVEGVVGTITAVDLFLGSLLGITAKQYTPPADGVLHVTLNRPDARNAMNRAMVEELGTIFDTIAMREAVRVSEKSPVLLDRFLDDAVEVDVDCISDGVDVMIGGIMEHIEQAGVHSGDSACSLPPYTLSAALQDELRRQTALMAKALKVVGLMNVQFAIQGDVSVAEGDSGTTALTFTILRSGGSTGAYDA